LLIPPFTKMNRVANKLWSVLLVFDRIGGDATDVPQNQNKRFQKEKVYELSLPCFSDLCESDESLCSTLLV